MHNSTGSARRLVAAAVLSCLAVLAPPGGPPAAFAQPPAIDGPLPQPLPLLPSDNWWNADVSRAPLDPNSQAFIDFINNGGSRRLHPDWGASAGEPDDPDQIYGIPYVVVPGNQPLVPVRFEYDDESDTGAPGRPPGYPIPEEVKTQPGWMEGGAPGNGDPVNGPPSARGDRHLLLVDRDNRILYELYALRWNGAAGRWEAGSGAIFPMTTNHRRPDTWTSADAAGLAILPGLVRYDEALGTEPIRHAFRVTVRATNGYVYPASHRAGSRAGALPMGARLRLKEGVDISGHAPHLRRIFQAMKTYGLIVADNGSDMFITGSSDPRWQSQMGSIVPAFRTLNASMFDVVQLGWQPTSPPDDNVDGSVDDDGDGLPTSWEQRFGLNPGSNVGADGAEGDPDGDLVSNALEREAGTHPRGFHQRYFAEGVSNDFFATRLAAVNPGATAAHVQFRFLTSAGTVVPHTLIVPARGRITLDPATVSGVDDTTYSTTIESDELVVVDRTESWDARGYGSHAEAAVAAPSRTWFLAEGATTWNFSLFYLLQNPNDHATTATIRYLRALDGPITRTYTLPPHSRTTIDVSAQDPGLAETDLSAAIEADDPIIAERAMYLSNPGEVFSAGHGSAGVTRAATDWFLAEGATGTFFDLFVLIANPSGTDADVRATYLLPGGSTLVKNYPVRANSRFTIYVDREEFPGLGMALSDATVSVTLSSINGVPIVVERTMWWPDGAWYESHNAAGSTETGTRWALGEGEVGGAGGTQTYILIANTSPHAGQVRVTLLYEGGGEAVRTYDLSPNSRTSVAVGVDFPDAANRRFGTVIESLGGTPAQVVVERAMYSSVGGVLWAAGTNAAATRLAP